MRARDLYIALGSDVGDRPAHLRRALAELEEAGLPAARSSAVWETEGLDTPRPSTFLNMVVLARSAAPALAVLDTLLDIERRMGRSRGARNAPRAIDLDLLWVDGVTLDDARLVLPHPRMWDRAFVIAPLAEVAPELRHPASGRSVAELARALPPRPRVLRLGPLAPLASPSL